MNFLFRRGRFAHNLIKKLISLVQHERHIHNNTKSENRFSILNQKNKLHVNYAFYIGCFVLNTRFKRCCGVVNTLLKCWC